MASLIGLKKEEKLALLKMMIKIADHYYSDLPEASKVIQETASHFNLPHNIEEAYLMNTSEAIKILRHCFSNKAKECFCSQLVSFMLKTKQLETIYNRMTNLQNGRTENQRNKDKNRIITLFRQQWGYAFDLTKEIFTVHKLAFTIINPLESEDYTFITKINPPKTTLPTNKQNYPKQEVDNFGVQTNSLLVEDELRKKLIEGLSKELKEEICREVSKELKEKLQRELRNELKEVVKEIINNELHSGINNFVQNNFNETLYKDL